MSVHPIDKRLAILFAVVLCSVIVAICLGSEIDAEADNTGFLPTITATKSDTTLSGDGDGKADPGEVIGYSVVVGNTGPDPATNVTFSDTIDANTTLVGGSPASSSVAVNDTLPVTVVGNVSIDSATITGGPFTVLTNDYLGTNPVATITSFSSTSASGGNVVLNTTTGTFTYNPPPGFEGTDTFTYTLTDNANATSAALNRTATVSITVSGMIWFINNNSASCTTLAAGCGRLSNPFSTLAAFQALNNGTSNNPATGDSIFLFESASAYTGGVTLLANQRLIGQDSTSSLSTITGLTPPTGSASLPAMSTGAPATTIQNGAGNGVTLSTSNTLNGFTASDSTLSAISGSAFVHVNVSDVIVNTNGQALSLTNGTSGGGGVNFTSVSSSGGTNCVNLVTLSGTFNLGGGAMNNGAGGNCFVVGGAAGSSGGSVIVNYSGTITRTTGSRVVSVENKTGGSVNFTGAISGTGTNNGVRLDTNSTASINFMGGLVMSTAGNPAFTATGGGIVNVCDENPCGVSGTNGPLVNTLTTTTATALNVASTTIGANNLEFRSISSNGGANGIVLNATGSAGGLKVKGTGSAGTGGTIQSKTGDGVSLQNTTGVSLSRMVLENNDGNGVFGDDLTNFSLIDSTVSNNGDTPGGTEGNLRFNELLGTCVISGSNIFGSVADNIRMTPSSGILTSLTISGTTIGPGAAGNGLSIVSTGTAVMNVIINGSSIIQNHFASGVLTTVNGTSLNLTVDSSTLRDNNIGFDFGNGVNSDVTAIVTNNTFLRHTSNAINLVTDAGSTNAAAYRATISGNQIGDTNVDSGSVNTFGIAGDFRGDVDAVVSITNNTIRHTDQEGIFIQGRLDDDADAEVGLLDLTLRDNTVTNVDDNSAFPFVTLYGTRVESRNTYNLCLDIFSNTSTSVGGLEHFRARQRDTSTFRVERLALGAQNAATMASHLISQNDAGSTASATVATSFTGVGDAACAQPPIAPPADEGARSVSYGFGDKLSLLNAAYESPLFGLGQGVEIAEFQSDPAAIKEDLTRGNDFKASGVVFKASGVDLSAQGEGFAAPGNDFKVSGEGFDAPGNDSNALGNAFKTREEDLKPRREEFLTRYQDNIALYQGHITLFQPAPTEYQTDNALFQPYKPQLSSSDEQAPTSSYLPWLSSSTTLLGEFVGKLSNAISPTVHSQEVRVLRGDDFRMLDPKGGASSSSGAPFSPFSGETITVNGSGSGFTLPAGKSVTITFSVTVDALDAGEIRTRILNQGSADSNETAAVNTADPSASADAACTASPPIGTSTCTPVDRPDTTINSIDRVGSTPTNSTSVSWTATFGTQIAGLTASNFTLLNTAGPCGGTPAITSVTPVGPSPATAWTIAANTGTGSCTLGLNLANDTGLSHDITTVLPFVGQTYVIDKTAPSTTSFVRFNPATSPTNADTLVFRVTFSENVTGVDTTDFTVTGTTATVTGVTGVGGGPNFTQYDLTVSGGDLTGYNGTVGLNLNAAQNITDLAGNTLPTVEPATDQTYLVDNTPPTVNIVDVSPDPRNTAVASIAINFSESVTGFDIADLTLTRDAGANLLPGGASITGGPANYTLSSSTAVTTTDGAYVLTLTAGGSLIVDAAGNALAIGDTDSWIKDAAGPTVTINQASGQSDPTFQNPINFTAIFNEPVTDFDDASDVVITGTAAGVGTATTVITPVSTTEYTIAVSGITGDGTIIANIPAAVAVDAATNPNVAATTIDNTVTFVTCVPPPSNMLAWYTGDGTPRDIAGGNDGTLVNGATYGAGKVGQALDFDGVNDVVTAPGNGPLNITGNQLSLDAWVYPRTHVNGGFIVGRSANSDHPYVMYNVGVNINLIISTTSLNNQEFNTGYSTPLNQWTHLAMTYDGTLGSNQLKLYANGVQVFQTNTVGTNLRSSTLPVAIGNRATNPVTSFNGLIDEVEIFNKTLTPAEVQGIFNADGGGKCKPSDLSITKSDGAATAVPGGTIPYVLTYENSGKNAFGVTITETVPANTTFNAAVSTGVWSCPNGSPAGTTCTFTAPAGIGIGSVNTVTFAVDVVNPVAAGVAQISNTATIADNGANGTELDTADNTATDTTPVNAQPDLSVTKSDGGASVVPGGTIVYALGYANTGNQGATGVVLTEIVPANTAFNAGASSPGWSCTPNGNAGSNCTLPIGAVAGGGGTGSRNFAVTVINAVPAGANEISNTATVADDGTNGVDPTLPNTASDTTPLNAFPNLTITKSDFGASTIPGGTISYGLSYSNIGNQAATNVVITETVPANTTFNPGASTPGWTCTPDGSAGSTCTINRGTLGVGSISTVSFAVTVDTLGLSGVTQISNTATIADDGTNGADSDPMNNTGNDTTPRACQPITVTNPSNSTGLIGTPFAEIFMQTGSFGGFTMTTASTLPNGLSLTTAGSLNGTPTETGPFPIVVTVTDGNGCTANGPTYNLNITCNMNPVVTNNGDSGIDSLRYAVATACSAAGQNTITFQTGRVADEGVERPEAPDVTSPISLSSGQITLPRDVVIQGPGANILTVQNTAAASSTSRVFLVNSGVTATISGLTISGGNVTAPGGGGINNDGTLNLASVTVSGNTAVGAGGIRSSNTLTVTDSTVSGNNATVGAGGGIAVGGTFTLSNSTLSGNSAAQGGGGLERVNGTGIISNSTITSNSTTTGNGGGVFQVANSVIFRSSIIAGNTNAGAGTKDVFGAVTSQGYNLIGIADGSTGFTATGDQTGSLILPLDPHIGLLANNGGPTQTHALCFAVGVPQAGCTGLSPALDKGKDFVLTGFDQRGNGPTFVRPFNLPDGTFPDATAGDGSDIGAFEANNTPPTLAALATARQAGSPSANSQVANAGDIETPIGDLTLTVNGGGTATVNGVTVTLTDSNAGSGGVNPTVAGAVFADVIAACGATTATFTLTVTDSGGLSTNATLTVTVTPNTLPTLTYNNPAAVVFGQSAITVNPATGPSDNGSVTNVVVQSTGTFAGNVSVNAAGVVSISNAGPVGTHTITIRATDNCGAVTDASFSIVVNRANTTTSVVGVPSPSTYGQSVTFTAAVAAVAPGAGVPTGTVTFRDGGADCATGTVLGAVALNGAGQAALAVNTLTAGAHTIRACYAESANFNASSGTASHTVNKAVLNVNAVAGSKVYGDADPALTAGFTGFVIVGENASNTGITGAANCTRTAGETVAGSPYTITCTPGTLSSPNYDFVTGTTAAFNITPRPVTVTADAKTKEYGEADPPLTFTTTSLGTGVAITGALTRAAGETVAGGPYAIQQGTVTNANNPNYAITYVGANLTITKAVLNVNAVAASKIYGQADPAFTWTLSGFKFSDNAGTSGITGAANCTRTAGENVLGSPYTITCTAGTLLSPNYEFVTGTTAAFVINQASTTTTITNAPALSNATGIGVAYPVNWTTVPVAPGAGVPTGDVTVSDGTGATCTAAVAAGTCQLISTTTGAKTITATYAGDGNFTGSTSQTVAHTVLLLITGNIKQFIANGVNTNLSGVLVTLSETGGGIVSQGTTDVNGNFIFGLQTTGGSYTVTPTGLGKSYDPISRSYVNVQANVTNADFVAYDQSGGANSNPRFIRVVNSVVNPVAGQGSQTVLVPLEINSQGNEQSISLTLRYDAALLGTPMAISCGNAAPNCSVALNTSTPGRAGVTFTRNTPLAAGLRQFVNLTFPVASTGVQNTFINMDDLPVVRVVRDGAGDPLPSLYFGGFVTFNQNALGLEGDVVDAAGGPAGGDGVLANDVSVLRQYVLGLATPTNTGNQFQRADAGPRNTATGTFGDGAINASDVTIARLYVLGLLPPTTAAGPTSPVTTGTEEERTEAEAERTEAAEAEDGERIEAAAVRVRNTTAAPGSTVTIPVEIDATGAESSLSFTLNWNPQVLTYVSTSLGSGTPTGSNLGTNTQQTATGKLGVLVDSVNPFEQGTKQVMTVTFQVAPNAQFGTYPITFSGSPTSQSVSTNMGSLVPASFVTGSFVLSESPGFISSTITGKVLTPEGAGLRNAVVRLLAADGTTRTATTSSFGVYTFEQVPNAQGYTLTVTSKRFRFATRQLNLTVNLSGVDLVGLQ